MNLATFERAQVAAFAYCEARSTGSLECMRAICYVLRNRVKAGWGDGSWLSVMGSTAVGNLPQDQEVNGSDRLLQMIVRDIDDIYLGQERFDDSTRLVVCGDNPPKTSALYYMFVDRKPQPWFVEHIIQQSQEHAQIGNIGPLMLYK